MNNLTLKACPNISHQKYKNFQTQKHLSFSFVLLSSKQKTSTVIIWKQCYTNSLNRFLTSRTNTFSNTTYLYVLDTCMQTSMSQFHPRLLGIISKLLKCRGWCSSINTINIPLNLMIPPRPMCWLLLSLSK